MSAVTELTRRLVAIPSHEDETAAGDAVATWFREETDAAVRRDDAGNVIARRSGSGASGPRDATADGDASAACDGRGSVPSLALVGHHDVVPPSDRQIVDRADANGAPTEFTVEERDGRLYGRGTADMKGALAAAMLAFRDAGLGDEPSFELVFASFVGEERGGVGARAAIDDGFSPDRAVVVEGSTGYSAAGVTDVAVAHKGRRGSTLVASGTSAHASETEAGENAIYRACDAVDVVRNLTFPETEVLGHEMRGSVAVTEIDGGEAWNVVPDRCEITVDERTVPGARADIGRVEGVEGVEWTVDQDLPPMQCDDPEFAEAIRAAAQSAQDAEPELVTKPHATDAGWLAEAGTTCVVCGPAEPGEAHTENESVSVEVLERCYRIYRAAAEQSGE